MSEAAINRSWRRLRAGSRAWWVALAVTALILSGCAGTAAGPAASAASGAGDPTRDKLAQILQRGTLVGYAELNYPPQSIAVQGASRATSTNCAPNQLTAPEVTGFDVETTKLIAAKLGVEACFVQPSWAEVTSGNWGDRYDIVYGSGAINSDRMTRLWMTQPYYYIPQRFVVQSASSYQKPSDLDGRKIGTCTSCTVESYLKGTLQIPGVELVQSVKNPQLVGYETEGPGLDALAANKIDAFLTAEPVGLEAIKNGQPFRLLDGSAFSMYPTGFVDKGSGLDVKAFIDRVNAIMQAAQVDGTMKAMSLKWFGTDYATTAAAFDLAKLDQEFR